MPHVLLADLTDAVWDSLWAELDDWEKRHANCDEIFLLESDDNRDRIEAIYEIGKTDKEQAFESYLALAESGSVWCAENVAWHYHSGTGVPADFEQSKRYYRRAITGGSWSATLGYAVLLDAHGYHEACDAVLKDGIGCDFVPAYFRLAWFRYQRSPDRATAREIRPLLDYAAREGHPTAKFMLAKFMLRGWFGAREIPAGLQLFFSGARESVIAAQSDPTAHEVQHARLR